jgi:hypothetical protein
MNGVVHSINKWYCWANFFQWYCDCLSKCPPKRGVNFGESFFGMTGLGHTMQMQCWMCSMRILMTECCLIIFLNGSDKSGPKSPYSPDLNPYDYFLWGFLKDSLQKQSIYNQRTATRNFSSSDQHQWRNSRCSCAKLPMSAADILDTDGAHIENVLHDCQSPKATEFRDTKYSYVCYIVR